MAATRYSNNDMRRQIGSPRSKGRDNGDIPCRNITIYGHCKYREAGCSFKHDQHKASSPQPDFSSRKGFNVESPAFTPSSAQPQSLGKKTTTSLPSQAANAAPFTPRGTKVVAASSMPQVAEPSALTAMSQDFTPSSYDTRAASNSTNSATHDSAATAGGPLYADPFVNRLGPGVPAGSAYIPYDQNAMYPPQPPGSLPAGVAQLPNYHLYQPYDAYKGTLQPHQKATYDFFIPQRYREECQKKMFATQQTLPNNTLPPIGEWQALMPLDTNHKKNISSFGFPSWLYKAYSTRYGRYFALRRIEGFGLSSEAPLQRMSEWRKIRNVNIVTIYEAFTTRNFNDSSLIFVYDFHPLSKTLQDHHFSATPGGRYKNNQVSENVLWSYICQIASALRAIHSQKLAARCVELSKIIIDTANNINTGSNNNHRIRLAACGIVDVTRYGIDLRPMEQLQQEDLVKFGGVIFSLATGGTVATPSDPKKARDLLHPKLSDRLKDAVVWLLSAQSPESEAPMTIDRFLSMIAVQYAIYCDQLGQETEDKTQILNMELENGRIARLMMKLATINERGDLGAARDWSETGERYHLKLFRDYVFHRVDADGKPDLGIGHMISCMTKLDAGTDEQIQLISRDGETVFIISYRELRQMLNRAFNELATLSSKGAPGSN